MEPGAPSPAVVTGVEGGCRLTVEDPVMHSDFIQYCLYPSRLRTAGTPIGLLLFPSFLLKQATSFKARLRIQRGRAYAQMMFPRIQALHIVGSSTSLDLDGNSSCHMDRKPMQVPGILPPLFSKRALARGLKNN